MQEKFYSTKEAADILKVSLRTFRRWKQAGKVTPDIVRGQNEFYCETQLRTLRTTEDVSPVKNVTGDTIVSNNKNQLKNKTEKSQNTQNNKTQKRSEKMETKKIYEDQELNRIKDHTAELLPHFLTPARNGGYVCPNCNNGNGDDGTGINIIRNNPHVVSCRRCGESWNIIQIAQMVEHIDFSEAVKRCADFIGTSIDNAITNSPKTPLKLVRLSATAKDFTGYYNTCHKALLDPENAAAMKYLRSRGLDDTELINHYQIGFDKFKNTIIIPHNNNYYTARAITDNKSDRFKYNPAGSKVSLFNVAALESSEVIFVTEGAIDALSLIKVGFQAVAVGGVTNYKTLIRTLENIKINPNFIILFDPDKAGRENSINLEKALTNMNIFAVNEVLPSIDDKDDTDANKWLIYNPDELKSIVAQIVSKTQEKIREWTPPIDDNKYNNVDDEMLTLKQRENLFNNLTADLDNAQKIIEIYGDKIRHITDLDRWAIFKAPIWHIANSAKNSTVYPFVNELHTIMTTNAITQDEKKIAAVFKSKKRVADAVEMCKAFPEILIKSKQFNKNPMLLNCPNGIVDLETGKLHPHDSNLLFTQCTGVEYRPGYHSETVENFLHSVLPNEDVLSALLIFLGYSLTGSVREDKALFIHGGGRNGKGSLMDALMRCLGDFAVPMRNSIVLKSRNFDDGENATPELAKLQYKRLAILDEIPAGRTLNESKFKNLTGGDQLAVRKLHQDPTIIDPTHKLILSGNFLPEIKDARDIAISERLLVIKFEQSFIGDKCDPSVRENLKKPEALTGLLTELVDFCLEWQELGRIFEPEDVKKFKTEYLEENDIVGEFIDDNCKYSNDLAIPCKDFIKHFRLNSNGGATMSDKAIIAAVEKIEGIKKHKMKYGRVFQGIGWIDESLYTS